MAYLVVFILCHVLAVATVLFVAYLWIVNSV